MHARPPLSRDTHVAQAISFRLSKLNVLDLFTQGAVFPHMLKVGGHDDEHAEDGDDAPELKKAGEKVHPDSNPRPFSDTSVV